MTKQLEAAGAGQARDLSGQGLAHDLANVFQTILDAAELVAEDPRWRSTAEAIRRSAERGQRLLRAWWQTDLGACDFESVLASAVQFARDCLQSSRAPEIGIRTYIEAGLRVPGSAVAWERILVNLLLNAAQATREAPEVAITAGRQGNEVLIAVADNGPGIPPALLTRIFEPYFSTKLSNTGLGLHIVSSLVERQGGEVTAANREGGGAEFRIRIPVPA